MRRSSRDGDGSIWIKDKVEKTWVGKIVADKFSRFRRGLPPRTKGDYGFILHMIETMKPGSGRMAVVVPHGVLFRGAAEGRIRQKLIEENLLDVVIGLPDKLFYGTGIPAAVLVFRKHKTDDKVLFIDASRDFEAGKNQNVLREADLQRILDTAAARQPVARYAHLATPAEIAENDFNLNIPRYVDTFEEEAEIDLMAVRREREQLIDHINLDQVTFSGFSEQAEAQAVGAVFLDEVEAFDGHEQLRVGVIAELEELLDDVAAGRVEALAHAVDRVQPCPRAGLRRLVPGVTVSVCEDFRHDVARHARVLDIEHSHQQLPAKPRALLVARGLHRRHEVAHRFAPDGLGVVVSLGKVGLERFGPRAVVARGIGEALAQPGDTGLRLGGRHDLPLRVRQFARGLGADVFDCLLGRPADAL